jgi:large subunit ribosomal protein L14
MIQLGSIVKVTDKTGVILGRCVKVLGSRRNRIAFLGDVVLVSVRKININRFRRLKVRWRKRFALGTLHRALVIRSKVNFCRLPGVFIKFGENAVVLVNKRVVPVSNRIYGPVMREFCMRWPSIGCVTRCLV